MRNVYLLFLIFLNLNSARAQCYVTLGDYSGVEPLNLSILNEAACAVHDSLPENITDSFSFRVFDFSFYLHTPHFNIGYPETFQRIINEASNQADFFLLFGRGNDENGLNSRCFFYWKLPNDWLDECYEKQYLDALRINYENELNKLTSTESVELLERKIMNEIALKFHDFKECCQLSFSGVTCNNCISLNLISNYFEFNEFEPLEATIVNRDSALNSDCICEDVNIRKNSTRSNNIYDLTDGYVLNIKGVEIDLHEFLDSLLIVLGDIDYNFIISDEKSFCAENRIKSYENIYNSGHNSVWFDIDNKNNRVLVKSKIRGIWQVTNTNPVIKQKMECIIQKMISANTPLINTMNKIFDGYNVFITEDVGNLKEDDFARSKVLEKAKIAIVWFREPDMINQYTHFLLRDLIHESAHNYLAILAANVNGRSNLRTYDYSTLWNYYNQFEDPISSTDHCIMARSTLFDEMLQTLIEVINDPFVDKKILIAGMMNGVTQSGCFVQNEKYNRTFKSFNEYLDYVGLFNHLYENSNCK